MAILYNEPISYSENNISYSGSIIINVPGVSSPIVLNDISLQIVSNTDYSNATVIGVISYDYNPSGVLEISTTQAQAEALISVINLSAQQQTVAQVSLAVA